VQRRRKNSCADVCLERLLWTPAGAQIVVVDRKKALNDRHLRISSYTGEEEQEQEKPKSQTSPPLRKKMKKKKLFAKTFRKVAFSQQFKEDRQREKKRLGNDLSPPFPFFFFLLEKGK